MPTTVQQILDAAYSKSTKNRPGTIATESTELLQTVQRSLRGLFAVAARVNPTFFGKTLAVTFSAPGWARPSDAESVFRIERNASTTGGTGTTGDEVVVVPFDDKTAESGKGALFRFGQIYRSAGNAPDPTGGQLAFYYAKRPADLTAVGDNLDSLWPEQFNELLILEVAMYLALKDSRGDELAALGNQRDRWAQQYFAFLEHETANERRRHSHVRRINTETLVPLMQLLAPGGGG